MGSTPLMARAARFVILGLFLAGQAGCSLMPATWSAPSFASIFGGGEPVANPLRVPRGDFETVWNKSVAVVGKYFPVASENRLSGTIRTESQMSGTILEPWSSDTATIRDRFESTLQTYRRFAVLKIEPAPAGGFLVRVEVMKELEDQIKPVNQPAGRAVFYNDFPVNRTREIVGPVPAPVGWIPEGRDTNMEQVILAGIRDSLML